MAGIYACHFILEYALIRQCDKKALYKIYQSILSQKITIETLLLAINVADNSFAHVLLTTKT